jgi:YebC/PmpR family DNA-binding regulatory protein
MSGHSHSANIKHKKSLVDNKRGKLWSKLSKAIIVAAKMGGGDPDSNVRLRTAILDARALSMPKDNIERAIKKGTGELDGGNVEEVSYEGYGPGGAAMIVDVMTDNRNRTAPEMRKLFEVHGGKLGAANCVAWMFERKGLFIFPAAQASEERLMEVALEAGGEDVRLAGDRFEVICPVEAYSAVSEAFEAAEIVPETKQLTRLASTTVELAPDAARKMLRFMEALDDHDDVQNVSSNFEISDAVMAEIEAGK